MYAIVNIAGKQIRVEKGAKVKVASLEGDPGTKVQFDSVLLTDDGKKVQTGNPTIKGASVSASILEHGRDKKILIYKKKRRKGYNRKNGHRQGFTLLQIDKIGISAVKKKASPKKEVKPDNNEKEDS
ncbi:MAG: 50S ribosomal protein L21 [Candidatus Marinimicrobia bacterium]|jgi:large subunit ribosomal protein L21|nr:50S ribosomal protein L21 [Candidatus Neomarinimicrobiota bacterium]MBT3618006.1 50S ribosomal protein L21 [Candidatus Neomarinimicrobiota bacterium]MBT3828537.1 50S ribosomal protein L21 [Candidatus Neomarinimicrobiota bacterium]MBT3997992.1 50S ribosomal protein L21 [Candidatus Neomarinimicrobiota bacterium]MBT4280304.1 50S ribosomal protein L21 [Candidatus Neomarinimicrobiota bacterium]